MSGQYEELAALKRRVWELERRVGLSRPAGPQPAELGEVTDDSPFVVTLTDGMEISPSTTFGGTAVVGDPALVLYPSDGDPVAVLQAGAGTAETAVWRQTGGLLLRVNAGASTTIAPLQSTGFATAVQTQSWATTSGSQILLDAGLYIISAKLGVYRVGSAPSSGVLAVGAVNGGSGVAYLPWESIAGLLSVGQVDNTSLQWLTSSGVWGPTIQVFNTYNEAVDLVCVQLTISRIGDAP